MESVLKLLRLVFSVDCKEPPVRNLERAALPRSAAMKMVGHKAQAFYQRYAIADESVLQDAAEKLEHLHAVDMRGVTGRALARSRA